MAQQPSEALKLVDEALASAREYRDPAGEARAHWLRAVILQEQSRAGEAVAAWREAAGAASRAGDGPWQIIALVATGMLCLHEKPAEAAGALSRAVALGLSEAKRPLAAAQALETGGYGVYDLGHLNSASQLWAAALRIRERHAPDAPEIVVTLGNLGRRPASRGTSRQRGPTTSAHWCSSRSGLPNRRVWQHVSTISGL